MKTIYILIFSLITLLSCKKSALDVSPLDVIGGDVVWNDQSLVNAYIANLYDKSELIENDDNSQDPYTQRYGTQALGAEAFGRDQSGAYNFTTGNLSAQNSGVALPYDDSESWQFIRAVNVAIQELSNENSTLSEDFRYQRLGEAYFLRAHAYFRKVIRYGGQPLIKIPQDPALPVSDLAVPRNTEKETYDFIAEDLDRASSLLSGKAVDLSRISASAAELLKSRAMLYAGSIAKNNGLLPKKDDEKLVGIDPSEASRYYQLALQAAKKILPAPYGTGSYKLRAGQTVSDYRKVFNDIGSANDTESILIIQYNGQGARYNNEGVYLMPRAKPEHVNWGGWQSLWLETLEWYEYKDGTPGNMLPDNSATLRSTLCNGQYFNLSTLFANKDPRFRGAIALPPYSVESFPAYMHFNVKDNTYAKSVGIPQSGPTQNRQASGMCVVKTVNENNSMPINDIGTSPMIVYRIAEAYLNYAEAAMELGDATGLGALNAIRTRAGMLPRTVLNMDNIMHERKIELAFEGHRFWDLRRWRVAQTVLSPLAKFKHVRWIWDVQNNTYTAQLNDEKSVRLFKPEHYYFPIPIAQIESNPILKQNPGY